MGEDLCSCCPREKEEHESFRALGRSFYFFSLFSFFLFFWFSVTLALGCCWMV